MSLILILLSHIYLTLILLHTVLLILSAAHLSAKYSSVQERSTYYLRHIYKEKQNIKRQDLKEYVHIFIKRIYLYTRECYIHKNVQHIIGHIVQVFNTMF